MIWSDYRWVVLTKHWDEIKKVYGDQGVQTTACFTFSRKAG